MRLAWVLSWKREDGTPIAETSDGLEEHKALVAKYEEETGSPIRPAYRGVIDRKYAKVAKKLAAREVGRAKSKGRADIREAPREATPSVSTSGSTTTARKSHRLLWASSGTRPLSLAYEQEFGGSSVLRSARASVRGCTRPSSTASSAKRTRREGTGQPVHGRISRPEEERLTPSVTGQETVRRERNEKQSGQRLSKLSERRNRQMAGALLPLPNPIVSTAYRHQGNKRRKERGSSCVISRNAQPTGAYVKARTTGPKQLIAKSSGRIESPTNPSWRLFSPEMEHPVIKWFESG